MRRSSQSAYQPGNKSLLGQSKFNGVLQGSALMGSKGFLPQSQRKIEGQDFGRTTKTNFEQTVNKLKSKPNQKVLQDEYIKGLQQQIKYLEYELKLLKDKEILEREGVNELDNFLKDQIPINENILAMKNKYKATKNKLEEQLNNLNGNYSASSDLLQTQKKQIQRLHQIINEHRKQVDDRKKEFKQKLSGIVKEITLTEDQYKVVNENNRKLQEKIKKMNEEISIIQRGIEKEKIEEVRGLQQKSKKVQKFQENSKKTKQSMLEALQKVEEMQTHNRQKGTNPLADDLQQKNSILRKQIMVNEKQKSTAENIIAEITLFLQEQRRERQIQRKEKFKITNAIDEYRSQLQNLERNSENMIKEQTLRTKKIMIREMTHDLQEKQDIYNKLKDRLEILEGQASSLISDKKDLQNSLQNQDLKEKVFNKKIDQLEKNILTNKCSSESLIRLTKQIIEETHPLKSELDKCNGRIPNVQKEIQKRDSMIHYLNKQVQLLKQLKSLDLDHLQMVSTSGIQMQSTLNNFIKSWEKLKSL